MSNDKILLIDDKKDMLKSFEIPLKRVTRGDDVEIVTWQPVAPEIKKRSRKKSGKILMNDLNNEIIGIKPTLVVTDFDLTEQRYLGLLGITITRWCQKKLIPVIEYSRDFKTELTDRPNLFRLHISIDGEEHQKVFEIYKGFRKILDRINCENIGKYSSYSELLFEILNHKCYEHELYQYFDGFDKNIEYIYQKINVYNRKITKNENNRLIMYVLGHIILNAILRFPGPIISEEALCAYVAVDRKKSLELRKLFKKAEYDGPFHEMGQYYWKVQVDEIIERHVEKIYDDSKNLSTFNWRNIAVRTAISTKPERLKKHKCGNCGSESGGYYCPYTKIAVCDSDDCSVSSSSWIPRGASICRVSKKHFNRHSPLIGY